MLDYSHKSHMMFIKAILKFIIFKMNNIERKLKYTIINKLLRDETWYNEKLISITRKLKKKLKSSSYSPFNIEIIDQASSIFGYKTKSSNCSKTTANKQN